MMTHSLPSFVVIIFIRLHKIEIIYFHSSVMKFLSHSQNANNIVLDIQ
jgi:hypothetical protein